MQKESGEFFTRYNPDLGGRLDKVKSLFYPGQALLSLLYLHDYSNDSKWLNAALKGLNFLAVKRGELKNYPPGDWSLIATRKLHNINGLYGLKLLSPQIINHAEKICSAFVNNYNQRKSESEIPGCFSHDGRTCYSASTIEGLSAALDYIPDNESELKNNITIMIKEGISFLINAQIKNGEFAGAITKTYKPWENIYTDEMEKAGEIRIDYVQHTLCALVNFRELKEE
jgi:hypothetical protein